MSDKPPSDKPSEATRLIRAGKPSGDLLRTVGPPVQKGSTVLVPNAAALYEVGTDPGLDL